MAMGDNNISDEPGETQVPTPQPLQKLDKNCWPVPAEMNIVIDSGVTGLNTPEKNNHTQ